MDSWAQLLAALGGLSGLVAVLFAIVTKVASSRTSNIQQVFEAQRLHMETLTEENASMRRRQESLGSQMGKLQEDRSRCERDKLEQERLIRRLEERVQELEGILEEMRRQSDGR